MCTGTHPFIPVPGVVEARMQFSTPGGVAENVLHYRFVGAIDVGTLQELGAFLRDWWDTYMKPGVPSVTALERIVLTDLTTDAGAQVTYTTDMPISGTSAAPSPPQNVTVAMTKVTGVRGRSHRGRVYHVGLGEDQIVNDNLITGLAADLVTAYERLILPDLTTDDPFMVVVSYCQDGVWLLTGESTDVINFACDGVLDSQRRRLLGRGA